MKVHIVEPSANAQELDEVNVLHLFKQRIFLLVAPRLKEGRVPSRKESDRRPESQKLLRSQHWRHVDQQKLLMTAA